MNGGNRMGGNGMGGNGMMTGEEDMGDDDLAVLQDGAVATAPGTAAASSAGPDPPVPKQPARPPVLPVVQYNKTDDAAITRSASMIRGVASYEDLDLRFANAHDRIRALQPDFPDRLLARLPLAISDTDVNDLAVEEGWSDDFLQGGPLRPPPVPVTGNTRIRKFCIAPAVPPKLPPVPMELLRRLRQFFPKQLQQLQQFRRVAEAEESICVICQASMAPGTGDVRVLACGHCHHAQCMHDWFAATSNYTVRCPLRCPLPAATAHDPDQAAAALAADASSKKRNSKAFKSDFRASDWLFRLLTLQPGDQYAYNPVEKGIVLNEEVTPVDEACDGLLSSLPHDGDSSYFREFKHKIAFDFNMVGASDREVWEAIPSKLQSFRLKGGVAKSSRWFSWNEQCAFQLQEYHACKMMFDWYFPGDTSASDSGLKALKGSFTPDVWEDAHIIYRVQFPMWNYFSEQIHDIKHPEQKIAECMNMMNDAWMQHPHLQGFAGTFNASSWADLIPWVEDRDDFIHKAMTNASGCLSNRCQTMAKFSAPPECWVGLLESDRNVVNPEHPRLKNFK
eukprot:s2845_g7.t1